MTPEEAPETLPRVLRPVLDPPVPSPAPAERGQAAHAQADRLHEPASIDPAAAVPLSLHARLPGGSHALRPVLSSPTDPRRTT